MPRKPGKVPSYCLHKHSGQAVVRINGQDHYLGEYGSPKSREKYARLVSELSEAKSNGKQPGQNEPNPTLSINELLLGYSRFAQAYYVKDGKPTQELACMGEAIWPVRELFGSTVAADFGPKSLKTLRQKMIDDGLARTNINHRVSRIKRVFKWAVAEELISPSTMAYKRSQGFNMVAPRLTKRNQFGLFPTCTSQSSCRFSLLQLRR